MGHALEYARVCTGDPDARLQHDALKASACCRNFRDTASGSLQTRPELDEVLDQMRPRDTLVVWLLGRSIRHRIDQMTCLQDRGIEFRSLQEIIATSAPCGQWLFYIFASLAKFQRDLCGNPPMPGVQRPARGHTGGLPPLLINNKFSTARKLYTQQDMTVDQIGEVLGASHSMIYRTLRRDPEVAPRHVVTRPRKCKSWPRVNAHIHGIRRVHRNHECRSNPSLQLHSFFSS